MKQDMPSGDALDIGPIDLKALSAKEWETLKQCIVRRAHAERAQAIGEVVAWLLGLRRVACRHSEIIAEARTVAPGHTARGPTEA